MSQPNPFAQIPCNVAADQIRKVLGFGAHGLRVATMLASLDKCKGGNCPGHVAIEVFAAAVAKATDDRVYALFN